MIDDYNMLLEIYLNTVADIITPIKWQQFLKTAAFNYKQDFHNQILIFAQNPNATVIMTEYEWLNKYSRAVQADKKIGMLDPLNNKVKYYYDISNTIIEDVNVKSIPIFSFNSDKKYVDEMLIYINQSYELNEKDIESAIFSAADSVTEELLEDVFDELKSAVSETPSAHFSENLLYQKVSRLISNSAAFMCLIRCGYPVENIFSNADFRDVSTLGSAGIVSVGTVMSRVSFEILKTIIKSDKEIRKKMYENSNRTFAIKSEQDYNSITTDERQVSDNGTELFRTKKIGLSQSSQTDSIQQDGNIRNAPGTLNNTSGSGRANVAISNRAKSERVEADGTAQGGKSGEMDWINDQFKRNDEGTSPAGADIQLNKMKAVKIENSLPLFLSQEQIDDILCQGSNVQHSKFRIFDHFSKEETLKNNIDFLKKEYGIGGTSASNILGIWYDAKGIEITSIDRKEKYKLSWKIVSKRIGQLINLNRYFTDEEIKAYSEYKRKNYISENGTDPHYRYSIGDLVYIGTKEYEIISVDNQIVLSDIIFPLSQIQYPIAEFENKLNENPLNERLREIDSYDKTAEHKEVFFIDNEKQSVTWMYYNPDSTAGGQYVTNNVQFEDIITASKNFKNPDDFFNFLEENCYQELADKGTEFFDSAKAEFENAADFIGCTKETMNAIVERVNQEFNKLAKKRNTSIVEKIAEGSNEPQWLQDVRQLKSKYPDYIVLYQVGDFYEIIGDDAKTIAKELDLVLVGRDAGYKNRIPMCGFPKHSLEKYQKQLAKFGYKIILSDIENDSRKTTWLSPEYSSDIQRALELISKYKKDEFGYDDDAPYEDLSDIGLAFTETEDGKFDIDVSLDLVNVKITQRFAGKISDERKYSSLSELIEEELESMSFDNLVFIDEDKIAELKKEISLDNAKKHIDRFVDEEVDGTVDFSNLSKVNIFFSELGDDNEYDFQVSVNLIDFSFNMFINGELVRINKYESLEELIEKEIEEKCFDDYIFAGNQLISQIEKANDRIVTEKLAVKNNYNLNEKTITYVNKKEQFHRNIEAIKVLKLCEQENRLATPEEQEVLSDYAGWGGLSDAFDENRSNWSAEYEELKELLTDNEYKNARASTLTAFYTPPIVIKAMYKVLENLGFKNGNILDPSCGIGNFFGILPKEFQNSKTFGIEIDSLSGRMAKHLYPETKIEINGFENTSLPDSFFDVIVGNVPFGDFKVFDTQYNKLKFLIHDYFIAKSIDKLRPGGVIAVITSNGVSGGTMDRQDNRVRKYIAQRCKLLGAIRLPSNVFSKAAGTDIGTDIMFLQKRERAIDIDLNPPEWIDTYIFHESFDTDSNNITHHNILTINKYYDSHPEMVLGEHNVVSGPFGPQIVCKPFSETDLSVLLDEAVKNINGNIETVEIDFTLDNDAISSIPADPSVRNYSFTILDGEIYYRDNSIMYQKTFSDTRRNRIIGMIGIRDCVRQLLDYQVEDYPDSEIKSLQGKLNRLYDDFFKSYGALTSRTNQSLFRDDCSSPLLFSLEKLDEYGNVIGKSDIFSKRTIKAHKEIDHADTAADALAISISERAKIDMEYMQTLTGTTEKELYNNLQGIIFYNPNYFNNNQDEKYLMADEYLSGNVRDKLKLVKELSKSNSIFDINVKSLEAVQPEDLNATDISVRLGSTWLPEDIVNQFIYDLLETPKELQESIQARYNSYLGEWKISNRSADSSNIKAYSTFGTKRAHAYRIIEDTLNLRDTRIFDTYYENGKEKSELNAQETAIAQGKQEAIKQAFNSWIWKDPERRHRLCNLYNEKFNSIRPREYDGSHIVYHGMNPEIKFRPHQNGAVAHMLYGYNTLLAHCVGAGKTFEIAAAAMESKYLGLCQKSIIVVPNHLTEQWASEFLLLYPNANLLVTRKTDFQKENRRRFCSKIATGNFDAIIIGQSQFEKIPMSVERQKSMIFKQISELEQGISDASKENGEHFSVKAMERSKRNLEDRLKRLTEQSRKDNVVTFEQLGVDKMFVDEAHYYKNLFLVTKMRNVAGIAQSEAQKSSDLFMKCQYLDEITNNKGVVFATGTPISNSMVELYTMQRYLQYDRLKEMGLERFDEWASVFGETTTAMELAPEGTGYRFKTRFAKFNNLPELMSVFKEVADIRTADMLNLPIPTANYHNIVIKPSEFQKVYIEKLAERSEAIHNRKVEPYEDNMLKVTNEGRKLALDERLIRSNVIKKTSNKVDACVDNVFDIWNKTTEKSSTQLIFCDLSTPSKNGSFNVYDEIKHELIRKGVPENEIAYIHNANSEIQKKNLFSKVRDGKIRVLIGSTQKMGAGTNVQDRLIALHHLDCPWRPSDLEQREGRIIRQGNSNKEVEIFRYVTEATFDSYMWQLVENKQKFIAQIMTSKTPVRSAEDVDETSLSYGEVKALASGNPMIMEKCSLEAEVGKLNILKANFLNQKYELEDKIIKYYPCKIQKAKEYIKRLTQDINLAENNPISKSDSFSIQIQDKIYNERADAGELIIELCKSLEKNKCKCIGFYRGFKLSIYYEAGGFFAVLDNKLTHTVTLSSDAVGNIRRIENEIKRLPEYLSDEQKELESLTKNLEAAKQEIKVEFAQEAELIEKQEKLAKVTALLTNDSKAKIQSNKSTPQVTV